MDTSASYQPDYTVPSFVLDQPRFRFGGVLEVCITRTKVYNLGEAIFLFPDDSEEPIPIEITDVFDLHSVPPREVKAIVEEYLEQAHSKGFRAIRIIHGRGVGVQREIVRTVLSRIEYVVAYGDAPLEAGGWGATVATLRQT